MTDHLSHAQSSAALLEMLADRRDADIEAAVEVVISDQDLFRQVFDGLKSKNEVFRYNCYKVMMQLSRQQPEMVYPEWEQIQSLLASVDAFLRAQAVHLLANLAAYDDEGRFEQIFEDYFDKLGDSSFIVARYVAQSAAKIVKAKPHLQERIIEKLLAVDSIPRDKERNDLIKSDILQAFDEYFDSITDKARILSFAESVLESGSPKARKAGKSFIKKHGS